MPFSSVIYPRYRYTVGNLTQIADGYMLRCQGIYLSRILILFPASIIFDYKRTLSYTGTHLPEECWSLKCVATCVSNCKTLQFKQDRRIVRALQARRPVLPFCPTRLPQFEPSQRNRTRPNLRHMKHKQGLEPVIDASLSRCAATRMTMPCRSTLPGGHTRAIGRIEIQIKQAHESLLCLTTDCTQTMRIRA